MFAPELDLLQAIVSIVVIDLVLSGDNAVVIGMASRRLPGRQRRRATVLGAIGAVILRVFFTGLAALLLGVPLLQAIGGLLLIWIAFKLLRQEEGDQEVRAGTNLFEAVRTIILADLIMSLDNILAVGGAAHGDLPLLVFGLCLSMPIILFGSNLVAMLMNQLPWLVYVGAAILVYTAAEMLFADPILGRFHPETAWFEWSVVAVLVVGTLGLAYQQNARRRAATSRAATSKDDQTSPRGPLRHRST